MRLAGWPLSLVRRTFAPVLRFGSGPV